MISDIYKLLPSNTLELCLPPRSFSISRRWKVGGVKVSMVTLGSGPRYYVKGLTAGTQGEAKESII